jgi:hypothetical protein
VKNTNERKIMKNKIRNLALIAAGFVAAATTLPGCGGAPGAGILNVSGSVCL